MGRPDRERDVVARGYVPDAGDLVWLTFDSQAGREQAGRRPALVLSPRLYNERSGLALVCPVTSRVKGYPFEVALPDEMRFGGVILADHLKSVDWKERHAEAAGHVPQEVLDEVLSRLAPLLGF
ncbi:MAG TPA: endoribonuclease MazF [Terriglobia bacterium]|nr:endoribonuclease MazF [Terriglobia bacterium]